MYISPLIMGAIWLTVAALIVGWATILWWYPNRIGRQ